MYNNGSAWEPRDPEGMTFSIMFYNGSSKPDTIICSYVDVKPSIIYTGIQYWSPTAGLYKKLYYFETQLDPCCQLSNGWISIQSTYCPSGGWFLWMRSYDGNNHCWQYYNGTGDWTSYFQDLAFVLTDGEPANPDLECDGELSWTKVTPGTNVTGDFVVRNNGDAGSILQWRIENSSLPVWGSNWTFTPSADFQTPDMGWITVFVNVTAPEEKNKKFTGKIKVVNAIDFSEYCEIDVYLKTPRSRSVNDQLLFRILERFPNVFPILRHLMRL